MKKHNKLKVVLLIGAILILLLAIIFPKATWAYVVELVLMLAEMGIMISMMKDKHNIIKIVLLAFVCFMILSWIIPAAYYSGEYVEQGRVQMGLFDMFNYPLTAVSYFGFVTLFIVLVGGFYGVLYKIPAYRSFLDKVVAMTEGHEKVWLSIMIVIIALLVSICGLHIGIAIFVPFIVAVILMMGYDKIVAAFVTVGSISAGLIGTTLAYNNISILTQTLSLKYDYQLGVRFVVLLAAVVLVIINTLLYIKNYSSKVRIEKKTVRKTEKVEEKVEVVKVEEKKAPAKKSTGKKSTKSNSKKSTKSSKSRKSDNKAALKDEDIIVVTENVNDEEFLPAAVGKKHSVWPITISFILLFVLMVLAFLSWGEGGFGLKTFDNVTKAVTEFELFGFPIFGKILGTINSFGAWSVSDFLLPMALIVLILVLIYKVSFDDVLEGFIAGCKKALGPAVISVFLYAILVLVTYHPFQMVIYNAILGMAKGFNIATTVIVALLAPLFNSDVAYTFQSVVPYYISKVTNVDGYSLVGIIFTSMYGLAALVAPTSLVLMGILSYLKVSYKDWLKSVWKLLLELFVVLLIVFIILALI